MTATAAADGELRPEPMRVYTWRAVFAASIAFRCAGALLVRTYFNPDEFWQSVEIAHEFVFG